MNAQDTEAALGELVVPWRRQYDPDEATDSCCRCQRQPHSAIGCLFALCPRGIWACGPESAALEEEQSIVLLEFPCLDEAASDEPYRHSPPYVNRRLHPVIAFEECAVPELPAVAVVEVECDSAVDDVCAAREVCEARRGDDELRDFDECEPAVEVGPGAVLDVCEAECAAAVAKEDAPEVAAARGGGYIEAMPREISGVVSEEDPVDLCRLALEDGYVGDVVRDRGRGVGKDDAGARGTRPDERAVLEGDRRIRRNRTTRLRRTAESELGREHSQIAEAEDCAAVHVAAVQRSEHARRDPDWLEQGIQELQRHARLRGVDQLKSAKQRSAGKKGRRKPRRAQQGRGDREARDLHWAFSEGGRSL